MNNDATRSFFACWYHLDDADRYLIWYVNDASSLADGVYLYESGRTLAFSTTIGIALETEDPALHNLDVVAHWMADPIPEETDCIEFLAAWNLIGDVGRTVGVHFQGDSDETLPLYDKLFWGNNLPSMTPEGGHYVTTWNDEETHQIAEILQQGLATLRTVVTS